MKPRVQRSRKTKARFCSVDFQRVKNTTYALNKGYDAGKKISGIKRHIVVYKQDLPHALTITTVNVTDRAGALEAFKENKATLSKVESALVDGDYFSIIPQRWIVERSFAWL